MCETVRVFVCLSVLAHVCVYMHVDVFEFVDGGTIYCLPKDILTFTSEPAS